VEPDIAEVEVEPDIAEVEVEPDIAAVGVERDIAAVGVERHIAVVEVDTAEVELSIVAVVEANLCMIEVKHTVGAWSCIAEAADTHTGQHFVGRHLVVHIEETVGSAQDKPLV